MIDRKLRQQLMKPALDKQAAIFTATAAGIGYAALKIGALAAKYGPWIWAAIKVAGPKLWKYGKHAVKYGGKWIKGAKAAQKLARVKNLVTMAQKTGKGAATLAKYTAAAKKARRAYMLTRGYRTAVGGLMAMPAATYGINRLSGYDPAKEQRKRELTEATQQMNEEFGGAQPPQGWQLPPGWQPPPGWEPPPEGFAPPPMYWEPPPGWQPPTAPDQRSRGFHAQKPPAPPNAPPEQPSRGYHAPPPPPPAAPPEMGERARQFMEQRMRNKPPEFGKVSHVVLKTGKDNPLLVQYRSMGKQ